MKHFAGQWLGDFTGASSGMALLDLDQGEQWLEGSVYAFSNDREQASYFAPVTIIPQQDTIRFAASALAIHPLYPRFLQDGEFPEAEQNIEIEVKASLDSTFLKGTWASSNGASGEVTLYPSQAASPSEYKPQGEATSWESFQAKVAELCTQPYRYIFRGQAEPWRLRTSFHRTHRKDLWRYWEKDIKRIRHASVGVTSHIFDSANPDQNGAFLHLLQHHGYPTPLLDWTYSPYIAAYFAFASAPVDRDYDAPVRIFMFDAEKWQDDWPPVLNMTLCQPHFSLLEPLAIDNDRALPQQSMAAVTNIDDIEAYIRFRERQKGTTYLRVFDLPHSLRTDVLRQLGLMGISPGSLFPGVEGLCREYRDRHFGYLL
ncbi:FRG domain-containing protein [Pseudophaeobacter sp. C1-32P7]|uniref:FRG domain-containing protein n=1 Tax=Pseudophaeobacter sp. C1-32P7 TaxID=3098142 RepID=UPI0034D71FE2